TSRPSASSGTPPSRTGDDFLDSCFPFRTGNVPDEPVDIQARFDVQALVETVLLLDDSDPFSNLPAFRLEVEAQDVRAPGCRLEKRCQHLDRGRLSGSVRSEEAEHPRPLDIEAHAVDRGLVPIEPG